MVLVELSVMEQRYQAVLAVIQDGWKIVEVSRRMGVSRQTVHNWIARYEEGGLAALADRSHRPKSCAHQIPAELEAMICELRRQHPGWGPRRIEHQLAKAAIDPTPSRSSIYRCLKGHGLIELRRRRKRRDEFRRSCNRYFRSSMRSTSRALPSCWWNKTPSKRCVGPTEAMFWRRAKWSYRGPQRHYWRTIPSARPTLVRSRYALDRRSKSLARSISRGAGAQFDTPWLCHLPSEPLPQREAPVAIVTSSRTNRAGFSACDSPLAVGVNAAGDGSGVGNPDESILVVESGSVDEAKPSLTLLFVFQCHSFRLNSVTQL